MLKFSKRTAEIFYDLYDVNLLFLPHYSDFTKALTPIIDRIEPAHDCDGFVLRVFFFDGGTAKMDFNEPNSVWFTME
jgi:hypothetical protein